MLCESCREVSRALTPVQSRTEGHIFLLCVLCQKRLREQRLMPIQWLNLACMLLCRKPRNRVSSGA